MLDKILWTTKVDLAFSTLNKALISSTVMKNPDPNQTFVLQTDASNVGVGAVLSQGEDDRPIAYSSWKLLDRERNYSTIEKECLAVVLGINNSEVIYSASHSFHKLITRP